MIQKVALLIDLKSDGKIEEVTELKNSNVDGESFFGKDVLINDGKAYVSTFNGIGSTISVFDTNNGNLISEIEAPEDSISFGYEIEVSK